MLKGEKRREEILRTAESLFYAQGYERTTVQQIIDRLHLSKGGFYHHFASKEALLQAICDRKAQESYEAARQAVQDCPGSWPEKFNALFDQYGMWQPGNADFLGLLIRVAYREDNLVMRDKLKRRSMALMRPLVDEIVRGGASAGVFLTPYPEGTGELLLQLGASFSDAIAHLLLSGDGPLNTAQILSDLELYRYAAEQILGAPYGSIVLYQMRKMVEVCTAIYEKQARLRSGAE